jgi:glycosyltransferase involved in cell wall biosynthesis
MYILTLGFRGFPGIEGGIETHAHHLYPLLAQLGCDVEVLTRSPYSSTNKKSIYRGVRLVPLWSPKIGGLEAFCHSFLGVLYASIKRPDILHIHAIGPSIMAPLARIFGLHVVVTHHGQDYDATKWGIIARTVLRLGEWLGMRFAHQRIVVSKVLQELIKNKYNLDSTVIPNGVEIPDLPITSAVLNELELTAGKYILEVGRITPHKNQLDLIKAFAEADLINHKLVIVGRLIPGDKYSDAVISLAEKTNNVILTGFRHGIDLEELYAHAGVFALPSSYEGMPISVLEALSYGLPVILSDIPAHLEIESAGLYYVQLSSVDMLAQRLKEILNMEFYDGYKNHIRSMLRDRYNWDRIAKMTLNVYQLAYPEVS